MVQLKAVFPHGAGFVLAFEYMLSDLAEVVRHAQRPLGQAQVKSYLQMLLKGVAFCHANNIVHRVSVSTGCGGTCGPALEEGSEGQDPWCGHTTDSVALERVGPGLTRVLSLPHPPAPSSCPKVLQGCGGTDAPFGVFRT